MLTPVDIQCPYCGESIDILIDGKLVKTIKFTVVQQVDDKK